MDIYVNDKAKLFDIAGAIEEIEAITGGMSFERFNKENAIRDEVMYELREIGMAARTLSEEFKDVYGDVDWEVLTNLQYATWDQQIEIDPHAIWYIVENDLPKIKDQIYDITTVIEDKGAGDTFFY